MWPALIAAAIEAGSGALAYILSSGDRETAARLIKQATDEYGHINMPHLEELAGTELKNIQTDPAYAQAQRSALNQFDRMTDSGGLMLEDQAALNKIQNQVATRTKGARGAIMQNMQARGMGGSGTELAALLSAEQDGAQTANQAGMDRAAMAQRRVYDAIMGKGELASKYRAQDYGEKSEAAKAQDMINRYNTGLPQQNFENSLSLAGARSGALLTAANALKGNAQQTQATVGGVGHGIAQGTRAYGAYSLYGQKPPQPGAQPPQYPPTAPASPPGDYTEDDDYKKWLGNA